MSSPAHTIDFQKSAKDAGQLMRKIIRGFLVVIKDKKPIGTLSDSDLIQNIIAENKLANKVKVQNIMSSPIVAVEPDHDMLVAGRKMKANNIHRLPGIK